MILVMVFAPALSVAGIFLFPGNKVAARIIGANVVTLVLGMGCYISELCKSDPETEDCLLEICSTL